MMRKEKIAAEIAKTTARIEALNAKLEELEEKYRQAEDAEILELVHAERMTPEMLAQVMEDAKRIVSGKKAKED